jgi:hypothetical protein
MTDSVGRKRDHNPLHLSALSTLRGHLFENRLMLKRDAGSHTRTALLGGRRP